METAPLKSFATWARRELITQISARLTAVLAPSSPERVEKQRVVAMLERDITAAGGGAKGRDEVADKVAYTWFNRIIALRFMDANNYTGLGVVSPAHGQQAGQPEILADAKRGNIDPAVITNQRTIDTITRLLDGSRASADAQGEAYTLLLAEYCRYWNRSMPFMFEREGDYTEILIPANLLAADSILPRAAAVLTEEVCREVEVIGWLYQFYISERKDEVFAGFKKGRKAGAAEIPAATQLFTPHWIVRYLVENSAGRLWMLNHPASRLVEQMDYYIAPVEEETDFLQISSPKELTVIDPACGSGHMLTYAFDLLYAIYEEEGYPPSEIPELILTHNLFGTEIDGRAGALAAFALTMKARAKQRGLFAKRIRCNVSVLQPISFDSTELETLLTPSGDRHAETDFWNQFKDADTFGSLVRPNADLLEPLCARVAALEGQALDSVALHEKAETVIEQASYLTRAYAVAIANPPYMGAKQMNPLLSQFMKDAYPDAKADLMTAFMVRAQELTRLHGTWAMINLPSWMALKSFEELRRELLQRQRIVSLVHLGRGVFGSDFGSVAFVIDNAPVQQRRGVYRRLFEQHVDVRSVSAIEELFRDFTYNTYEVSQMDFAAIPGSPIVYWLSEKMRRAFATGRPLGEISTPLVGLRTGDNGRFMRQWWEVSNGRSAYDCESLRAAEDAGARWFPYNKGGAFRRWYGNHEYVVNWEDDGREIEEGLAERYPYLVPAGKARVRGQGRDRYFSPSVSWSDISSGVPSFRLFPQGFIHGNKGNSLFGSSSVLVRLLAVLNAQCASVIVEALAPTMTASVGDVGKTPIPDGVINLSTATVDALVATTRVDWDESETSWNFSSNLLVAATQARRSEAG